MGHPAQLILIQNTVNDDLARNVNALDHETFGLAMAMAMTRGSVLQEGCSDDLKCNK